MKYGWSEQFTISNNGQRKKKKCDEKNKNKYKNGFEEK